MFTGCYAGNKQNDNNNSTDISLKSPNEATLTFYFPGKNPPADKQKVLNKIEQDTKGILNTMLDFKWINWRDYYNKINELLASGDTFDAFCIDVPFGKWAQELIKDGLSPDDSLLDISELFPMFAPTYYSKFNDYELKLVSFNDKVMAIPSHDLPKSKRICAVVREDLMKQYKIPEIRSYEDYENYLNIIKKNNGEIIPATLSYYPVNELTTADMFAESYGYGVFDFQLVFKWNDPKMTLIPWEQTAEFRQVYDTLKRWYSNGYINNSKSLGEYSNSNILGSFVAYMYDGLNDAYTLSRRNTAYELKAYPLYPDEYTQWIDIPYSIILNKNAKNPERVLQFIEWIQSNQENYDLFMYGIKDENYSLANELLTIPDGKEPYAGWQGSASFLNYDYSRQSVSLPSNYKDQYLKAMELNSKYCPFTGFLPDLNKLNDIITSRRQTIESTETDFRNGNFSKSIDEIIKERRDIGVDELVNTLQKQLNDWKSKQSSK